MICALSSLDRRAAQARLKRACASVDDGDLWGSGCADDPAGAYHLSELFTKIIAQPFTALRDGERFWSQTDLTGDERRLLGEVCPRKIIRSNAPVRNGEVQNNVFVLPGVPR